LGIEAFSGVLSGGGTGILGPLWQRASPPNWGVWSAADTALASRCVSWPCFNIESNVWI